MQRLWAPWRMDYILAAKQKDCFLCEMIQSDRDRDNLLLQRRQHSLVVMNRYPYNNGHCMVAPYRHVAELHELNDAERLELMQATSVCVATLKQVMRCDGANVGINLGEAAGAGLREHLHIHIVPRWEGDTNFMPVLAATKVMPQALFELYDQLLPYFPATKPLTTDAS